MGSSHSSASWKLDKLKASRRTRARTESDVYRPKTSMNSQMRQNGNFGKWKSENNLLDEMRTRTVHVNPLYRHQEMFDNDSFFEEILAKIEQEAAKLSSPERQSESPKGFDSFMMY